MRASSTWGMQPARGGVEHDQVNFVKLRKEHFAAGGLGANWGTFFLLANN